MKRKKNISITAVLLLVTFIFIYFSLSNESSAENSENKSIPSISSSSVNSSETASKIISSASSKVNNPSSFVSSKISSKPKEKTASEITSKIASKTISVKNNSKKIVPKNKQQKTKTTKVTKQITHKITQKQNKSSTSVKLNPYTIKYGKRTHKYIESSNNYAWNHSGNSANIYLFDPSDYGKFKMSFNGSDGLPTCFIGHNRLAIWGSEIYNGMKVYVSDSSKTYTYVCKEKCVISWYQSFQLIQSFPKIIDSNGKDISYKLKNCKESIIIFTCADKQNETEDLVNMIICKK